MDDLKIGTGVRPDSDEQHEAAPDYATEFAPSVRLALPPSYQDLASDMRSFSPLLRHDQTTTSTCCANAMTRAAEIKQIQSLVSAFVATNHVQFALDKARQFYVPLSRRALYYWSREKMPLRPDGTKETTVDEGTQISICADVYKETGACPEVPIPGRPPEESWDWQTDLEALCTSPSWMAARHAYVHKIQKWAKIKSSGNDRVDDVIANLAVNNPVAWATKVGRDWMNYSGKGALGLQADSEGNHATVLVGWDPHLYGGVFIDENSWGAERGDHGFFYIAPEVIASADSFDFVVMMSGWEAWRSK